MATAVNLSEWEDPGMAFPLGEVEEYNVRTAASLRIAELQDLYLVLKASEGLPYGLQTWANSASANVRSWITWVCRQVVIDLPEIRGWEFTLEEKEERRPYTARSIQAGPWGLACAEAERVHGHLVRCVTIGRRANGLQRWKKSDRSVSNKYCTALVQQYEGCLHWKETIRSQYPPSKRGELEG